MGRRGVAVAVLAVTAARVAVAVAAAAAVESYYVVGSILVVDPVVAIVAGYMAEDLSQVAGPGLAVLDTAAALGEAMSSLEDRQSDADHPSAAP
jgi:hypothetical protein